MYTSQLYRRENKFIYIETLFLLLLPSPGRALCGLSCSGDRVLLHPSKTVPDYINHLMIPITNE